MRISYGDGDSSVSTKRHQHAIINREAAIRHSRRGSDSKRCCAVNNSRIIPVATWRVEPHKVTVLTRRIALLNSLPLSPHSPRSHFIHPSFSLGLTYCVWMELYSKLNCYLQSLRKVIKYVSAYSQITLNVMEGF